MATKPVKARLALLNLRSCLVNLPASVVNSVNQTGEVPQDIAVEVQIPRHRENGVKSTGNRSVYLGWTGLSAKGTQPLPPSYAARRGKASLAEAQSVLEIDSVYGRRLGLYHGQEVTVFVHFEPPEVSVLNVEPVSHQDWTAIELHAGFLEEHLLSQIRIIPNPVTNGDQFVQPLIVHLSPTTTANLIVSSTNPQLPRAVQFAKIAPNAEAIVAPKPLPSVNGTEGSVGRRTINRSSTVSKSKIGSRAKSKDQVQSPIAYLRGVARSRADGFFDMNEESDKDHGFRVWIPREIIIESKLADTEWVFISKLGPSGFQSSRSVKSRDDEARQIILPRTLVARLAIWDEAPQGAQMAISSPLCHSLQVVGMIGGVYGVRDASKNRKGSIKTLAFRPIRAGPAKSTKLNLLSADSGRDPGVQLPIRRFFASRIIDAAVPIVEGQLTEVMLDDKADEVEMLTTGTLRLCEADLSLSASSISPPQWILSNDCPQLVKVLAVDDGILPDKHELGSLPEADSDLVGVKKLVGCLSGQLVHSNVLLTGSQGSGKTSIASFVGHRLSCTNLCSVQYINCEASFPEDKPPSYVRDYLDRVFSGAAWETLLAGHAVVILDDIDVLCPAEKELQVGDQNGRARQLAELVSFIIQRYCNSESQTTALLTARSKEDLHASLVNGHAYRFMRSIRAPNKSERAEMLAHFTKRWDREQMHEVPVSSESVDFLEVAGQAGGYVAEDLRLLSARALTQTLIRCDASSSPAAEGVKMTAADYEKAFRGFTPASLRNVNLQSSQTKWSSIGGLEKVRKILLETIQYPTMYAPIFKHCPLRLRSGLLLYGYPGCGKTLLASAVAGECGLNFISVKGPEILNKYIGASEKSIRDLFERASSAKPCVLFFDEFESVAPRRGHDSTGVTDRVVNQLLTEMDGAEGLSGVYILAATSRPDLIDPALLRPGRLDKSLMCGLPTEEERLDILRAVSRGLKLQPEMHDAESDESLTTLARITVDYSGADLQALLYNAHLGAVHDVLGRTEKKATNIETIRRQKISEHEYMTFSLTPSSGDNAERYHTGGAELEQLYQQLLDGSSRDLEKGVKRNATGDDSTQHRASNETGDGVVIDWDHTKRALESTRPSVPASERRRLQAIYSAFNSDRTGEVGLPDGQASTEIGGRISLM